MNVKLLKHIFNHHIFYFLFILLLLLNISSIGQNVAIAQNTNQQQSNNSNEHFSLVLPLDNEGRATVNYSFQQNNLFAFVYGKSNLKVINLDSNQPVYEISDPDSYLYHPYLLENYLVYLRISGQNYETIRVDLSTEEPEIIIFPGTFEQVTDDGHLIIYDHDIYKVVSLEDGSILFEPEISKSGETLCIDDVIVFPFKNSRHNPAGYKATSTAGEEMFILPETFNEVQIVLPSYRSKISTFPLPILRNQKNLSQNECHWFLEFADREGNVIASNPIDEPNLDDSNIKYIDSLFVADENQSGYLLEFRYYREGESLKFHYIFVDLSGNIIKVFDEQNRCDIGFDQQGGILLLPRLGSSKGVLQYYQQDGNMVFEIPVPCLVTSGMPREFKFPGIDEVLGWEYNQFTKYSLVSGQMTGIYPISTDYQIYDSETVIYNDKIYFFARPRGGVEPPIPGSNLFSFSAADSGWLDIELVFIKPNAGTIYEVYNNTDVRVKFKTEYGSDFGKNLTVNFEKGTASATNNNLEYIWHTPIILNGNEDTSKITVSYGQVKEKFGINIINPHPPRVVFEFSPSSPETGESICFVGYHSVYIGGSIDFYHWDFGDEDITECLESSIEHIFSQAGEYIVTLSVKDNQGGTAQISQNIEVVDVIEAIETSLQVKVLDEEMPLEGVNVTLLKSTDTDFIAHDIMTGIDGTCEFSNLEVGDYQVLLEDLDQEEGYIPPGIREVTLAEGANSIEINVEPSKGFGVAFFKNAPPGLLSSYTPDGYSGTEWEWRPIWVSNKNNFKMPESKYLRTRTTNEQYNYRNSTNGWKNILPSIPLWHNPDLYILGEGPSTVWRGYEKTLYSQLNGSPIPIPLNLESYGYSSEFWNYQNPYAFTGTLSATELPTNWYLDPFKRWVVESAMSGGLPNSGNWGIYSDMATFWGKEFGPAYIGGQSMGTPGVGLYLGLLVIEYFAVIEYNKLVIELENDYQNLYHCSSTEQQLQHNYFSLDDPSLDKPVIVRRDVPNYTMPSNVTTSIERGADCIDGFTLETNQAIATSGENTPISKVVMLNKAFTAASIPFQFVLHANTIDENSATSRVGGRFFIRLYLPPVTGPASISTPDKCVELNVVGVNNGKWLEPWTSVHDTIDMMSYQGESGEDNPVTINFSDYGTKDLLLAWAGEIILRAQDFGVDRFEKVEFGIDIETALGEEADSYEEVKAKATLSVQPIFSRNIAEAGPWKAVTANPNTPVSFVPDANFLPSNVQSVTYEWYLEDELIHAKTVEGLDGDEDEGVKRSGASASHTFYEPGIYTVWLKVDPDVPEDADNADLFNDVDTGVSYDICKVWVYQSP